MTDAASFGVGAKSAINSLYEANCTRSTMINKLELWMSLGIYIKINKKILARIWVSLKSSSLILSIVFLGFYTFPCFLYYFSRLRGRCFGIFNCLPK
jgi:hypothetical protein